MKAIPSLAGAVPGTLSRRDVFTLVAALLAFFMSAATASASTATSTGLVSSSYSVTSGTAVTLTAAVTSGSGSYVGPGQVLFCDASVSYCTDIHRIGSAQLVAGSASLTLRPSSGSHQYRAIFVGTGTYAASTSPDLSLTVTPPVGTTTTITQSGTQGSYSDLVTVSADNVVPPAGVVSIIDRSNSNYVLGTGTLAPGTGALSLAASGASCATGQGASAIVAGDFNGDGLPDLVIANSTDNTLTVCLSQTGGYFQSTAQGLPTGSGSPSALAVGDFNNDGKLDLAVNAYSGSTNDDVVAILLGNGDGTFSLGTTLQGGYLGVFAVFVGDFDGDGNLDVGIVGNVHSTSNIEVFFGSGDGTFPATTSIGISQTSRLISIVAADVNNDGITDLLVAGDSSSFTPSIYVELGSRNRSFTALPAQALSGNSDGSLVAADFNGDGNLDVALPDGASIILLTGVGDGTFATGVPVSLPGAAQSIAVGDFNGDGKADVGVTLSGSGNNVLVLTGNGDETFSPTQITSSLSSAAAVAVADFNNDGFDDLAVVNGNSATLVVANPTSSASVTLGALSPVGIGNHQVVASYSGDTYFAASVSNPVGQIATQITGQQFTLSANLASGTQGQQVVLSAVMSPYLAQAHTTDGETVTFNTFPGGVVIGTGTFSSGVATLQLNTLPLGTSTIQALYQGDTNFASVATNDLSYTVHPIPVAVGTTGPVQTAIVTVRSAGTLGAIYALSSGVPNLDYKVVPGGSCVTGTAYGANATCTVNYTFQPIAPGQRKGAVQLVDASGTVVLGTALLSGTGSGAALVFPGNPTTRTLGSGIIGPTGVAVDGAGNIYVTDVDHDSVSKIVAVGGVASSSSTVITLNSSFTDPTGLALDGAGNLYVADTGDTAVKEMLAVGGVISSSSAVITLQSSLLLQDLKGIAVDGAGDVYFAQGNGEVSEIVAVGGVTSPSSSVITLSNSFSNPGGIAVDEAGNVYVADSGHGAVKEIVAVNGAASSSSVVNTLGGNFASPSGVAVDAIGNVYVSDGTTVKEIVAAGGVASSVSPVITLGTLMGGLTYVAVDDAGNVYVGDNNGTGAVSEILMATPSTLSFASTAVGSSSTDSPQSLMLQNIGNADLNFSVAASAASPADFSLVTGAATTCPVTTNPGATTGTLASGGTCALAYQFHPQQAGGLADSSVLTDNSLGASATQMIALLGAATQGPLMISVSQPAPVTYGAGNVTLTASVAYAGLAPSGGTTFIVGTAPSAPGSCVGTTSPLTCTATYSIASLAPGNYAISVADAGDANYRSASGTGALTILQSTPQIVVNAATSPDGATQPVSLSAALSYSGMMRPSGTFTFMVNGTSVSGVCSGSASPLTCSASFNAGSLAPGLYPIAAMIGGDAFYNAASSSSNGKLSITATNPVIVTQSASQTISAGQSATLSVAATGTAPLSYQWFIGVSPSTASPIAGATAATYKTPSLNATSSFWVQVDNNSKVPANSATVAITVITPPTIISQSPNPTIATGHSVSLSAAASGTSPAFQWFAGSSPNTNTLITGATSSNYTTPVLSANASFWVQARNQAGTANSGTFLVTVDQPPTCTLTVQPATAALTVVATSSCSDPQAQPLTESIGWGDGTSSSVSTARSTNLHTFAAAGTYTVSLTATDTFNLTVTATQNISPSQSPVCTLGPILAQQPSNNQYPVSVIGTCTDPQGQALTLMLNWGDGIVTPVTNAVAAAHTYPLPAAPSSSITYNLVLTAVDSTGVAGSSAPAVFQIVPSPATVPSGGTSPISTTVPPQPIPIPSTQVTFVCSSVSTVIEGQIVNNVLPSLFGISCTSPTVPLTTSPVPVHITVLTTSYVLASLHRQTLDPTLGPDSTVALCGVTFPFLGIAMVFPIKPRKRRRYRAMCAALAFIFLVSLTSCGGHFVAPPMAPTPSGTYYLNIVEVVVNPPAPTAFVQTSLIVPLQVTAQ